MFLDRHYQIAYVTSDIDRAMEVLQKQHGVGDFTYFEVAQPVWTPQAEGDAVLRLALAFAGDVQYELVQPVSGVIDLYRKPIAPDRPFTFHHVAMRADDWDGLHADIKRNDRTIAISGEAMGGAVKFLYVDARDTLGHYLEYVSAPAEFWAPYPCFN